MHTFIASQSILQLMYIPYRIAEQQSTGLRKIQFFVKNRFVTTGSEQPFIPRTLVCYYHDYLRNLLERRQADIKKECLKLWKVCAQYHVVCMLLCCIYLHTSFPVGQVHLLMRRPVCYARPILRVTVTMNLYYNLYCAKTRWPISDVDN